MARLFALDRNFPQPIVDVLAEFQADAKLVSLDAIDPRLSTLDDWELLRALHHHAEPWDGPRRFIELTVTSPAEARWATATLSGT